MTKLAISCMIRNNAFYLKEWIEYHLLIGVEHFYLANNLSTDHYMDILESYIKEGIVTLVDVDNESYNSHQFEAIKRKYMNEIIKKTRDTVEWLALLDSDEFITPIFKDESVEIEKIKTRVYDILQNFKNKYPNLGGVGINWRMYGSSDIHKLANNEYILDKLNHREKTNVMIHRHIKVIVIPARAVNHFIPHNCSYLNGYNTISMGGKIVYNESSDKEYHEELLLTHYNIGDNLNFIENKVSQYMKYNQQSKYEAEGRMRDSWWNTVEDNYMSIFSNEIKKKLGNTNLLHHSQ